MIMRECEEAEVCGAMGRDVLRKQNCCAVLCWSIYPSGDSIQWHRNGSVSLHSHMQDTRPRRRDGKETLDVRGV